MRCETCRDEFTPRVFLQKNCLKKDDCIKAELELKKKIQSKSMGKKKNKSKVDFKAMELRVKAPNRKKELGEQSRLLARNIDNRFGYLCIDCGKPYGKQQDAAHLHNSGGNENITYNLHNLHSARSYCNRFSSEHKVGYREGIEKRYGKDYLDYIDNEIPLKYSYVGLSNSEIAEKLKIVRKLNRTFDTYTLKDGKQARDLFNKIIGIYK